jgi:hypothetical protein|nr:hypothetical protein [Neorhizobium tomejilense]
MIYMGMGGDWAPHAPRVDILISERLKARGHDGTRDETKCLYGSTIKSQALDYARNGDESYLKALEPQPGCIVSWVPSMKDMLLDFQSHINELRWNRVERYRGVNFGSLARDIAGDISIVETYLSLGRQKRAIRAMIDSFLDGHVVFEHRLTDTCDIMQILGDHEGEIWFTGPCLVHDYDPSLHAVAIPKSGFASAP